MTEASDTGVIRLNTADDFTTHSASIIGQAVRKIDVLAGTLELSWLGNAAVVDALKQAVLGNHRLQLRILIANVLPVIETDHPLLPLIRRLSRIEARVIDEQTLIKQPLKAELILVDRGGIVMRQSAEQFVGFAHQDDKQTVAVKQGVFDQYWRFSKTHSDLRHVYL
ncbi:hypothetical protein [Reinekea marinisedimentorum]|uniref:DUF7931 domain-containing protein n=1 Tax=Reinekea marinisedimentorum TaxID=230495 RepID=A0A4V2UJW1_9GAMM|nr:hypothetical protein [Reinekea marinisedimentorum]TCS41658.1 hypothetical protein BCF53_10585 [Reinekea marinisedimentorum]